MKRINTLKLFLSVGVVQFLVAVGLTWAYAWSIIYYWDYLAIAITIICYWGLYVLIFLIIIGLVYIRWLFDSKIW